MTSLPIPRWFRELAGVRLPDLSEMTIHFNEETMTMKLMILGSLLAVDVASGALLVTGEAMTQNGMILASFIGGSFGLLSMIGVYGVVSPKEIAQQALASVPTAGMIGPSLTYLFTRTIGVEINVVPLIAVGWIIGFGGPYMLRKYGQQLGDLIARIGESRIKKEFGDGDKP